MKLRITCLMSIAVVLIGCATTSEAPNPVAGFDMEAAIEHMEKGVADLPRNALRARDMHFAEVLVLCEEAFADASQRLYSARTPAESLFYMLQASVDETDASVIAVPCGEASYLSAYASIDVGDINSAEIHMEEALRWSPRNSMYLSEQGHIYHIRNRWSEALNVFAQAEDLSGIGPDETQQEELLRAKRGMGFSLIELGRLEEAKAKYVECLEIDPNDEMSKSQLSYIEQLESGSIDIQSDPESA